MQEIIITGPVIAKAKELKVTPKFLLYSLAAIVENRNLDDCFYSFFYCIASDMKEQAEKQLTSKSDNVKAAGKAALSEVDVSDLIKLQRNNFKSKIDSFIETNNPVQRYYLLAHQLILTDFMQVLKIGAINGLYVDQDMESGFINTIKHMCAKELKNMSDFARLFESQDIALN